MSEFLPETTITGEQIKAARAVLRVGQRDFAVACHISVGMLRRMEKTKGPIIVDDAILKAVQHALEAQGIELISAGHYQGEGGPGIRMIFEPESEVSSMELPEELEATNVQPLEEPKQIA